MIPLFDYLPEYRRLESEFHRAIRRVLESGRLILGPEVRAFEEELAAFTGSAHAVGVASGTDAITLALMALEIGAGDEVITVANAGVPATAAIRAAGATPRFVDVEPERLLLDVEKLEAVRTAKTRCVLPVHLYGQVVPMQPIISFAKRHGLVVVEDCAQAHGSLAEGRHAGTFGSIGCFSFYPTKNLGAFGDGGACITGDAGLAERLRSLRSYGWDDGRRSRIEGRNSRLDELQAAILRVRLSTQEPSLKRRREIAEAYREALQDGPYGILSPREGVDPCFHLFVVQTPERARLLEGLREAEILYGLHYDTPVHLMPAYRFLGYRRGDLPVTERACDNVVSLPFYPDLPETHRLQVIETLRELG